jgi:hypothetical protein
LETGRNPLASFLDQIAPIEANMLQRKIQIGIPHRAGPLEIFRNRQWLGGNVEMAPSWRQCPSRAKIAS